MMKHEDRHILVWMNDAVNGSRYGQGDVGVLADRLVILRDQLQFSDPEWYGNLSQHIATLDSASTFQPRDDNEAEKMAQAIANANARILELVTSKCKQLR